MGVMGTPEAVTRLRDHLTERGFKITTERCGDMGGSEAVFAGAVDGQAAFVRITSDRGHWALEVRIHPVTVWIAAFIWDAYLERRGVSLTSIDEQATTVTTRLDAMANAAASTPGLEAALVRMGVDYMGRRLME
jgi:hypothetical protein